MDIYHGFIDLKPGVSDMAFAENLATFLNGLKADQKIAGWRLTRRKLGLGPNEMGEFHLMIEVDGLAQLDAAFGVVARRDGTIETRHFDVNSMVDRVTFALYRDFPDGVRQTGEERF